jgi:hypothetical protein
MLGDRQNPTNNHMLYADLPPLYWTDQREAEPGREQWQLIKLGGSKGGQDGTADGSEPVSGKSIC